MTAQMFSSTLPLGLIVNDLGYSVCKCDPFYSSDSKRTSADLNNPEQLLMCPKCRVQYEFAYPLFRLACVASIGVLPVLVWLLNCPLAWYMSTVLGYEGMWRVLSVPLIYWTTFSIVGALSSLTEPTWTARRALLRASLFSAPVIVAVLAMWPGMKSLSYLRPLPYRNRK